MTIAEYYIGMLAGIVVVLIPYFISRKASGVKRGSICDRCKNLRSKSWNGEYFCSEEGCHYFAPKYCCHYKEREDEHGST